MSSKMAAMQLSFESLGIACQPTVLAEGWWGKELSGQKREGRKQGEKRNATRRNGVRGVMPEAGETGYKVFVILNNILQ